MRPLRITMKGFGTFRERTDIDLADVDLVALVGPTGSGKSTIIDAITFALYGTVARYEDNRLVAPVINQTSNEARVALDFELDGQVLTAARVVRRTTGGGATTREARLEQGDNVLADDATSMSQEVEGILGLDVEQFNRTVVLPQGKFATFLHDKPKDRQATLVRLLGVELYQRIGQAARRRATRAGNQVDALRPDFDREARELIDERRAAIESRIQELDSAHGRFKADRLKITALDTELRDLKAYIEVLDGQLDRMGTIEKPDGLTELADQITKASEARIKAEEKRRELSATRLAFREALENGPEEAIVKLGLEKHSKLAQRSLDHAAVVARHGQATRTHESAKKVADQARTRQGELEGLLQQARESERSAQAALASGVTTRQVEAWAAAHARHEASAKDAGQATLAARSAEESVHPLLVVFEDAHSAAQKSSDRLAELRRRAGVLGLVDLLRVGSACPLCSQEVHELPVHDLDVHLEQAQTDHELAQSRCAEAKRAYEDAERERITAGAAASAALKSLADREAEIASIPQTEELDALRSEAEGLSKAVARAEEATRDANIAAIQHRESSAYSDALRVEQDAEQQVAGLAASKELLSSQLELLRSEIASIPGKDELEAQLEEANRLKEDLDVAESASSEADSAYEKAKSEFEKVKGRRDQAIRYLLESRDRIAAFGPPALEPSDPATGWEVLEGWIRDELRIARDERETADAKRSAKSTRRDEIVGALRERCAAVFGGSDPRASVDDLGEMLATNRATSDAELKDFDRRRSKHEEQRERIRALEEQKVVAERLGRLLRANMFERWLLEATLEQLVARATGRLYELSGGQYSLTSDDKSNFAVRDHTNADEVRSARTLSGGETFLASLSLALAVADATAELAPEGAPRMESIFLDEGFGTLDPHTLDTVATAVEELGTTGRFVGIVTHIRELADRMPVRLEVTKTGGSASVERIET
ncbi:MAG: SMC family ATPase [bacterium]|nr:SMC family ATPase [bacterium]